MFVSSFISCGKIDASPDELAAAFAHAIGASGCSHLDGRDSDRTLTFEQLAGFAVQTAPYAGADGCDGFGTVFAAPGGAAGWRALMKVRVKCREAGLLGRPFPGEAFAKLDLANSGRVTRLSFKHALRDMGFALVDESLALEVPGSAVEVGERHSTEGAQDAVDRNGIMMLGDLAEEGDEDQEEVRLSGMVRDNDDEKRKAFRDKVAAIEKAVTEKVNASSIRH